MASRVFIETATGGGRGLLSRCIPAFDAALSVEDRSFCGFV
jgi:hypothetical protein